MMRILVGTEKGAYLLTESGPDWQVDGPMFPGWKVTAFGQTTGGAHVAAAGSNWFGVGVHHSENLLDWKPSDSPPAWPEGSERKMEQVWTFHNEGDRLLAGVAQAGVFSSDDGGMSWYPVTSLNEHRTRDSGHQGRVVSVPIASFPGAGACGSASRPSACSGQTTTASPGCRRTMGFPRWTRPRAESDRRWGIASMVWPTIRPSRTTCGVRTIRGSSVPPTVVTTGSGSRTGLPAGFGFVIWRHPGTGRLLTIPLESSENRVPVDGKLSAYASDDEGASWGVSGSGWSDAPAVHRCPATGFRRRRRWWILLRDVGREVVAHP